MKTETIRARVQPELKHDVEIIFKELGLNATEAITLFYQQVKLHRGIPFELKIPNDVTLKTFRDTDAGRNLTRYDSLQDAFADLDALCETPSSRTASKKTTSAAKSRGKTLSASKK